MSSNQRNERLWHVGVNRQSTGSAAFGSLDLVARRRCRDAATGVGSSPSAIGVAMAKRTLDRRESRWQETTCGLRLAELTQWGKQLCLAIAPERFPTLCVRRKRTVHCGNSIQT